MNRIALVLLTTLVVVACSGTPEKRELSDNAAIAVAQLQSEAAQANARAAAERKGMLAMQLESCAGDSACVIAVKAIDELGAGVGRAVVPQQPVIRIDQRNGWEKFGDGFFGFAKGVALLTPFANVWASIERSDDLKDQNIALYDTFGDIFSNVTSMPPAYNVGGDWIDGDGNVPGDDNVVGDGNVSGDGSFIGDGSWIGDDNVPGNGNAVGDGNQVDSDGSSLGGDRNFNEGCQDTGAGDRQCSPGDDDHTVNPPPE